MASHFKRHFYTYRTIEVEYAKIFSVRTSVVSTFKGTVSPGWLAKRAMLNSHTEERNRWWFIDFSVLPSIFNSNLSPPEQCRKKLIDRRISRDCKQICKRLAKEINGFVL